MIPQTQVSNQAYLNGKMVNVFACTGLHKVSASIHAVINSISPVRNVLMRCSVSILLGQTKVNYVDLKSNEMGDLE